MAEPFLNHRTAARALLAVESLSEREGQFCGGMAYRASPLTDKQSRWLLLLLERHGLPALADGGAE